MPPPPAAPFLNPTEGRWIFDSSTLINLAAVDGLLGLAVIKFAGRAHIAEEVLHELDRGPLGARIRRIDWFTPEPLALPEDLELYRSLRKRWGSTPFADRGEAATLVLALRNSWRAVIDDGVGYRSARDHNLCCTRTPHLVVSFVRRNWLEPVEGWDALEEMTASGHRLGPTPWVGRPGFEAYCDTVGFDSCD